MDNAHELRQRSRGIVEGIDASKMRQPVKGLIGERQTLGVSVHQLDAQIRKALSALSQHVR